MKNCTACEALQDNRAGTICAKCEAITDIIAIAATGDKIADKFVRISAELIVDRLLNKLQYENTKSIIK